MVVGIAEIGRIADELDVLVHVERTVGLKDLEFAHGLRGLVPRVKGDFPVGHLKAQALVLLGQDDLADVVVPHLAHQQGLIGALLLRHLARYPPQRVLELLERNGLAIDHADRIAGTVGARTRVVGSPFDDDQADEGEYHKPQDEHRLLAQQNHHKLSFSYYLAFFSLASAASRFFNSAG